MNADGSDQNRLTSSGTTDRDPNRITSNISGDSARDPAWSSDGAKIAFTTTRDGNPEIYVMNADGSVQIRLTNNEAFDYAPAWSPDGRRISFTSHRDGNGEIYVMNTDGSDQTRLTNTLADDIWPAWSPFLDGN
jgi:TolB protein